MRKPWAICDHPLPAVWVGSWITTQQHNAFICCTFTKHSHMYINSFFFLLTICKAQTGYVNEVHDGGPAPHWCRLALTQLPITRVTWHIGTTSYHPTKSFCSSRVASMLDMNEWAACRTYAVTMPNVIGLNSRAPARTNKTERLRGFGQEHFNERLWVVASSSSITPILNTKH